MDKIRQLVGPRSIGCQYHSGSLGIGSHFRTRGQCIGGSRNLSWLRDVSHLSSSSAYGTFKNYTQCVPGFSNPDQKVHGLFHFYIAGIYKTDQNQLKKPSVIRFPKFTSIDMAEKCHQRPSFSIENMFFEDYCFGTLMTDGFLNWF